MVAPPHLAAVRVRTREQRRRSAEQFERIQAWTEQAIIDQEVLATRQRLLHEYRSVFPQL